MLQLKIPDTEFYDERNNRFVTVKGQTLQLEHSLVSVSKWEAKWKKPFMGSDAKTAEETIDYIRCMTITQNVNPVLYDMISQDHVKIVMDYINDPMTATTIKEKPGKGRSRQIVTSEIIYYQMTALNIPFDPCQKWHLNRLLMLIRVCAEKNEPPKKMSRSQTAKSNHSLNAARRARMNTRG